MGSMHGSCNATCLDQLQQAQISTLVRAGLIVAGLLLVSNLVLVGWIVAMRGGRLNVATSRHIAEESVQLGTAAERTRTRYCHASAGPYSGRGCPPVVDRRSALQRTHPHRRHPRAPHRRGAGRVVVAAARRGRDRRRRHAAAASTARRADRGGGRRRRAAGAVAVLPDRRPSVRAERGPRRDRRPAGCHRGCAGGADPGRRRGRCCAAGIRCGSGRERRRMPAR